MRRWIPFLTLTVFVLTAVPSVIGAIDPALVAAWQREPSRIAAGEWYRLVTSLVTQDGGVPGTVSNLLFLLVLRVLAERQLGRWRWLLLYLGGAVAGQVTGCVIGTVGAGNSIAILGLAGGLVAAYTRGRARSVDAAAANLFILLIAVDGLSGDTARTAGYVAAIVLGGSMIGARERLPRWLYLTVAVVVGGWLTVVPNLHGPALLTGLAIGSLIRA